MCCLKYENDEYEAAKAELPDVGEIIKTPDGAGRVIGLNILERVIQVDLSGQERTLEYTLEEISNENATSVPATE